jgi:phage tail tape-measure protein
MSIFGRRKRGARKIAATFDALQSDLNALRKDARQLASGVSAAASGGVEAAQNAYGGVERWTSGNIGSMRNTVRGQPLAACLVSLGVGAVLGALFVRR